MQFQKSIKGVKNEKDFTFVQGGALIASLLLSFGFVACSSGDDDKDVKLTGITISGKISVEVGETITLTATKNPTNATTAVSWAVSDSNYATIESNDTTCQVTGKAKGRVTVTAKGDNATDTWGIQVVEVGETPDPVGIDFSSYPSNYAIQVKNNTSNKLVAFKGMPSQGQIIGGIPASGNTHYIKKDPTIFSTTTDFLLYVVTVDDYNTYYKSSPETLDASPFTILYAFYNTLADNEEVYNISKKIGGEYQIVINNGTDYNVELRNMGPEGEIIGYSKGQSYERVFHVTDGEYMIFPVFRKYDRNTGEIYSVYPTYSSGDLAGEAKSYEFSLDSETKTRQFQVRDWVSGINFTPSATYIKITNNADQGLQFFTGADSTPVITSTGGKRINTDKSLIYAINMQKLASNKYEESVTKAGYRVETNRGQKAYLAGDATTTVEYRAGYMYTYTITGTAETGYTATPVTEADGTLKAQEVDWSNM